MTLPGDRPQTGSHRAKANPTRDGGAARSPATASTRGGRATLIVWWKYGQPHSYTQGWRPGQPHSGAEWRVGPGTKPHSRVECKGRASHTPGWRGRASDTATLRGGGQASVGGQEGRLAFGEAPASLLLKNVIHISATKLFCSSGGQPLAQVPFLRPPRSTFDPTRGRWA